MRHANRIAAQFVWFAGIEDPEPLLGSLAGLE
jgi:hypothetical protein